jgi:hypothetical protein
VNLYFLFFFYFLFFQLPTLMMMWLALFRSISGFPTQEPLAEFAPFCPAFAIPNGTQTRSAPRGRAVFCGPL